MFDKRIQSFPKVQRGGRPFAHGKEIQGWREEREERERESKKN